MFKKIYETLPASQSLLWLRYWQTGQGCDQAKTERPWGGAEGPMLAILKRPAAGLHLDKKAVQ